MATLTIEIPDDQVARINNAFASRFGYDANRDGTKSQFTGCRIHLGYRYPTGAAIV